MPGSLLGSDAALSSALLLSAGARVIRRRLREKAEAKARAKVDAKRAWLAERMVDGRTHPVDAITLQPVIFDREKPTRKHQRRILNTASRFSRGRGRARLPTIVTEPEEIGVTVIDINRQLKWRMDAELERNKRLVPTTWDATTVDLWLQAAFETLFRLPVRIYPKAYGSCMPIPTEYRCIDWADEVAQAGNDEREEPPALFGLARLRTLGMPEKYEIDRMNAALQWPVTFLAQQPFIARCVGHGSLWKALDVSFTARGFKKLCKRRFHCWPEEFDRARGYGLTAIAGGLNAAGRRPAWGDR